MPQHSCGHYCLRLWQMKCLEFSEQLAVALPNATMSVVASKSATALRRTGRSGKLRAGLERMNKPDDEGIRTYSSVSIEKKGMGPGSAGQSGDTQGLSNVAEAGTESVEELVEEGQSFEAEVTSGVEDAPDSDVAEVHTKEVPADDVPSEYLGRD